MRIEQPKDQFNLQRFIDAQELIYATAIGELIRGEKRTHWMWYVFTQTEGGTSERARHYAIGSRTETRAYLGHPLLGARLLECTEIVFRHARKSAHEIFGAPDDLKFRSCMTLFNLARGGPVFEEALDIFYQGQKDEATPRIYASWKEEISE